ncbi:MAG: SpoIIE family protein phosphatase [Acidobacteriota bacterium]|jgi:serine phosphatase RsbU (regulator of sigma subunit)|nr:SpoIIE family protein phosphatase [Bryobacteraceae bacterium CoA2 C42]MCA2963740.1 SpoIIE family protein phosphatase [Acidobacteriaceae bacterium]
MQAPAPVEIQVQGQDGTRQLLRVAESPFVVGRADTAALAFPADNMLSRLHFALEFLDHRWTVRDLGSKNGTSVNGQPLTQAQPLSPGDTITAGHLVITFQPQQSRQATVRSPLEFVDEPHAEAPASSTVILRLDPAKLAAVALPSSPQTPDLTSRRIDALVKAGKELAGFRPLGELFEVILELSLQAVDAKRGVLMTIENGQLLAQAHRGEGFRVSKAVRDKVINERSSLLVRDASLDALLQSSATIVQQRIRSLMAVPLQTDTQVTGMLYVDATDFVRSFDANDLSLLTVLANIAAIRIEHSRLLEVEQAEKFMARELEQAAEIQRGLLPRQTPEIPGLQLAGRSAPCRSVGGDYFDFFPLADGRLAFLVADVAGKGLSAALLMSNLQARVQALMEVETDIARLVTRLNHSLKANTPDNKFITGFFAILDPRTGSMTYTNAGHNPPILVRRNGKAELLTAGGPVLGILPNIPYLGGQTILAPGESLVLYSDGVSEAPNAAGEEFGEDAIAQIAVACHDRPAQETMLEIGRQLRAFLGDRQPIDDVTLLVVRRLPAP